jgi:hypothetical protein
MLRHRSDLKRQRHLEKHRNINYHVTAAKKSWRLVSKAEKELNREREIEKERDLRGRK